MLIKLTALPHPDINGGRAWPVYIDPRMVMVITRCMHQHVKLLHADLKRELYDDLFSSTQRLHKFLHEKWPEAIDTSESAAWAKSMNMAAGAVNDAYNAWGRAYRADDFHPKQECTELQLACGTALEHGVMLARVWVSESPEQVADLINPTDPRGAMRGLP